MKKNKAAISTRTKTCPVCSEVMDLEDQNFYPCSCGYQVCLFCWHRIRTSRDGGGCPLCRTAYTEDPAEFQPISQAEHQRIKHQAKQEQQKKKQVNAESRRQLLDIRIIQKNLIYVCDLPQNLASDKLAYKKLKDYFKSKGQVRKFVFNPGKNYSASSQSVYTCAYVTYARIEDALRALRDISSLQIHGKDVRATLGTTKYCSFFIKNSHCPKKDCVYMHEFADENQCFSRDEVHAGKHIAYGHRMIQQVLHKENQTLVFCYAGRSRTSSGSSWAESAVSSDQKSESSVFAQSPGSGVHRESMLTPPPAEPAQEPVKELSESIQSFINQQGDFSYHSDPLLLSNIWPQTGLEMALENCDLDFDPTQCALEQCAHEIELLSQFRVQHNPEYKPMFVHSNPPKNLNVGQWPVFSGSVHNPPRSSSVQSSPGSRGSTSSTSSSLNPQTIDEILARTPLGSLSTEEIEHSTFFNMNNHRLLLQTYKPDLTMRRYNEINPLIVQQSLRSYF